MGEPLSLYIHWPFCVSKCPYCAFNSRPVPTGLQMDMWQKAYAVELAYYAARLTGRQVATIYFGGGTPSLMPAAMVFSLIELVAEQWPVLRDCEVTLEANPSASSFRMFRDFADAGVNRFSIGVQALSDPVLRFLGRSHDAAMARRAVASAQETGRRVSVDLIYGYVGQTEPAWRAELSDALAMGTEHLSLYQLALEEGTTFYKRARVENLTVSEELAARLYVATQETTASAGRPAYEVSNHARRGGESRHNMAYWRYRAYVGIGPGAHGRLWLDGAVVATENLRAPDAWVAQVMERGHGSAHEEVLSAATMRREALMMGLRLFSGIDKQEWASRFGEPLDRLINPSRSLALVNEGFLYEDERVFFLTPAGMQRLNAILEFL